MLACDRCHRHFREADGACPFCARKRLLGRAMTVVGGAVTTVILAACYGAVDGSTKPTNENTGDTGLGDTSDTAATTTTTTTPSTARDPILFPERDTEEEAPLEKAVAPGPQPTP